MVIIWKTLQQYQIHSLYNHTSNTYVYNKISLLLEQEPANIFESEQHWLYFFFFFLFNLLAKTK